MKKLLSNIKFTIILCLISGICFVGIPQIIYQIMARQYGGLLLVKPNLALSTILGVGLILYSIIVLLRMSKVNIKIVIANIILIISMILESYYSFSQNLIVGILTILIAIYVFVVLFNKIDKVKFINNKLFLVLAILYIAFNLFRFLNVNNGIESISVVPTILANIIGMIFIIPYFYNYYKLLKEGK